MILEFGCYLITRFLNRFKGCICAEEVSEIEDFLTVCGHREHLEIFRNQDLCGKRLEFIDWELLSYCGVPKDDAKSIVDLKSFFVDWLSLNLFCTHSLIH